MIPTLEICCYSSESVLISAQNGAQRVELCSGRLEGGTSPSAGLLQASLHIPNIEVFPILRPRGGDFLYSHNEFDEMLRDVVLFAQMGAKGFVTGMLLPNGDFDYRRMYKIKSEAPTLEFCVHRAVDMCRNSIEALELLKELGVKRVLSSGRKNTAIEGLEMLGLMYEAAGNSIEIMAGSGVKAEQIPSFWDAGIRHFHASAGDIYPSQMLFKNEDISMSKDQPAAEFSVMRANGEKIKSMAEIIHQCAASA
jgi:copper homeostasis protein